LSYFSLKLVYVDPKKLDLNSTKKGIGLNSLSSRVELVNGNINYESNENAGTMAIVRIPFIK
jgi:signal transduction histidine kinase